MYHRFTDVTSALVVEWDHCFNVPLVHSRMHSVSYDFLADHPEKIQHTLGFKYASFRGQIAFYIISQKNIVSVSLYRSHLEWWKRSMHGFCSSFVYFCCCKYYVTPMSIYQWLNWYDGSDGWVRCKEECIDLPVPGGSLAMPWGLCTEDYVVEILRWFRHTSYSQMM